MRFQLIALIFLSQLMPIDVEASSDEVRFDAVCSMDCTFTNWKSGRLSETTNPKYYTRPILFSLPNITAREYEQTTEVRPGLDYNVKLDEICRSLATEEFKDNAAFAGRITAQGPNTPPKPKCELTPKEEPKRNHVDAACTYACKYVVEICWDGCWESPTYYSQSIDFKGLTNKEYEELLEGPVPSDLAEKCVEIAPSNVVRTVGAVGFKCIPFTKK